MEGSQESKGPVRITLLRNLNRKDVRTALVSCRGGQNGSIFTGAVQAASNKFRFRQRDVRLFDSLGRELDDTPSSETAFTSGAVIIASAGEPFMLPPSSQTQNAPTSEPDIASSASTAQGEVVVLAKQSLVEETAVRQLRWVAALPGVVKAVGLPDLHPGPSCPIGTAVTSRGLFYPALVGSDIGCGVMLVQTTASASSAEKPQVLEKWTAALNLEGGWTGEEADKLLKELSEQGVESTSEDNMSLGTVGRGNHFAELQAVESVLDAEAAAVLNLDASRLVLCVHSGSRGLGERILTAHSEKFGQNTGLAEDSLEGKAYMQAHDNACRWAEFNRWAIARRFLGQLGWEGGVLLDMCHNHVVNKTEAGWLHRKGAAPSDSGAVVIPGSRGAVSYLVVPNNQVSTSNWSLAHGAGRKLARSTALAAGRARYPKATALTTTSLGSRVVCDDKDLLYEEAPESYKDVGYVIADLVEAGLCRVVAVLRPVLTYKQRAPAWSRDSKGRT